MVNRRVTSRERRDAVLCSLSRREERTEHVATMTATNRRNAKRAQILSRSIYRLSLGICIPLPRAVRLCNSAYKNQALGSRAMRPVCLKKASGRPSRDR